MDEGDVSLVSVPARSKMAADEFDGECEQSFFRLRVLFSYVLRNIVGKLIRKFD